MILLLLYSIDEGRFMKKTTIRNLKLIKVDSPFSLSRLVSFVEKFFSKYKDSAAELFDYQGKFATMLSKKLSQCKDIKDLELCMSEAEIVSRISIRKEALLTLDEDMLKYKQYQTGKFYELDIEEAIEFRTVSLEEEYVMHLLDDIVVFATANEEVHYKKVVDINYVNRNFYSAEELVQFIKDPRF